MRLIPTFAVAVLMLAGCQTQTEKQSANSATLLPPDTPVRTQMQPKSSAGKGVAFDTDDCAARMHALAGQLMLYYFKYQKLPNQLAELQAFSDPGEDVPTICPVSHRPYIYNPGGMVFGNDMRRLIVYDAAPSHEGTRWGIIFGQAHGQEPINMIVITIPEQSMVGYRPAPSMASAPAQSRPDDTPTPTSIDQLSPELRQKVLEQQRLLQMRRQQLQQNPQGNQGDAQPQQPIQQPSPQQPRGPQQ